MDFFSAQNRLFLESKHYQERLVPAGVPSQCYLLRQGLYFAMSCTELENMGACDFRD